MTLSFYYVFCFRETVEGFVMFTLHQVSNWVAGEVDIFLEVNICYVNLCKLAISTCDWLINV